MPYMMPPRTKSCRIQDVEFEILLNPGLIPCYQWADAETNKYSVPAFLRQVTSLLRCAWMTTWRHDGNPRILHVSFYQNGES